MLGRREGRLRPAVRRWRAAVDDACRRLNPILIAVVIGLLIVDVSCYAALESGHWRLLRPGWAPQTTEFPAMARNPATRPR